MQGGHLFHLTLEIWMEGYFVEAIGVAAGVMTTCSFLPQVIKAYRTRDTKSLSLLMYMVLFTGTCTWLTYGVFIGSFSIILANAVTGMLVMIVLILKLRYG